MRDLNLLIPSIHRPTHHSLCKCLRNNGEREIHIVGVDMANEGVGRHIADVFYQVPPRTDCAYLDTILDICQREQVDVYYALGEEEALAASEKRAHFEAFGISVITPGSPEMLDIATNKCLWHDFFAKNNIQHAKYEVINSFESIADAAIKLGYPDKDIVIKPSIATGGRGTTIITSKDLSRIYYKDRSELPKTSLASLINMFTPLPKTEFIPLIAMEYLPGTIYSVDVLSKDGSIIYVVPKIRISGSASNTTIGQIDLNPAVIDLAMQACKIFNFSFMQNYEMKMNGDGQPRIFDINPRGGASVALCAAAGVNIAYYAVKMAIGEEIPQRYIKDKVKMIRCYDEFYE